MTDLASSHVVVAVGGSVAASKAAHLVDLLKEQLAEVRVAMTAGARHFADEQQLAEVSGHHVYTDIWEPDPGTEHGIAHIALGEWAEVIVVCAASANLIARLAHGLADDIVTTFALASQAPMLIAPGMETVMWEHPATAANVELLMERGVRFVGPVSGTLKSGKTGMGRMVEPTEIVTALQALLDLR